MTHDREDFPLSPPEDDGWKTVSTKNYEIPLRDGAVVVIADFKDLVPMGDGVACRKALYRRDGLEVAWEIQRGVPECTSVTLRAEAAGLLTRDLHAIRLDDIRETVYSAIGIAAFTPDGEEYEMSPAEARKAANRAASRRTVTDERIKRVAEIHRGAPEGRRTAAVAAAFQVHERTALRYIAKAREEGYLHG
ncbi:hypothetical protein A5757_01435 [Mycobacterium sp. 852013-51886_SCH5428379]|uniref:hypothetical protein n=1 Tax=Mycobacterium sp. 852013-51886_SCH5428379 TaxID=1834111 RepID=UPI00080178B1|nr:hypothetical protein [Mycobacterium sp. 852013-51886_SCH5428379]OBB56753.1 hypothetical protein A5757_01435 [Mycobacterium sp. 852013-51886_SCH5428379]